MGEWLPRKTKRHRCVLPVIDSGKVGARWRCDCGVVYVVVMESQHGESWQQFRREDSA